MDGFTGRLAKDRETGIQGWITAEMKCQTGRVFVALFDLKNNDRGYPDPLWIDPDRLEMLSGRH
jgi:hypothetical protein